MSLNISLAEARAEAVLLRMQMHQKGCTCKSSKYQEISDRLCKVLAHIQYKERLEKNWPSKQDSLHPSLPPHTDLDCPPTMRPFFKGQNNQKLCLSFHHSLGSHLTNFFCTIYCIIFHFFIEYSFPQTFSVYQTIAISLLTMFFTKFLAFLGLNSTFYQWGDSNPMTPYFLFIFQK